MFELAVLGQRDHNAPHPDKRQSYRQDVFAPLVGGFLAPAFRRFFTAADPQTSGF
ncbi:MAG: hypothetical protein ACT4PZ_12635 [Panacagrimonas sp.]